MGIAVPFMQFHFFYFFTLDLIQILVYRIDVYTFPIDIVYLYHVEEPCQRVPPHSHFLTNFVGIHTYTQL